MNTNRDVSLLLEAGLFFERALSNVAADEWSLATPCVDWDVADLVDHVVGGNRWAGLVLNGVGGEEALAEVRASEFGRDRVSEYATSSSGQLEAFSAEGALDRTVEHLVGPISGAEFLQMRVADLTIHGWDLARAVGAEERLPDSLVRASLTYVEAKGSNVVPLAWFGPATSGPGSTDRQVRLLRASGRQP